MYGFASIAHKYNYYHSKCVVVKYTACNSNSTAKSLRYCGLYFYKEFQLIPKYNFYLQILKPFVNLRKKSFEKYPSKNGIIKFV